MGLLSNFADRGPKFVKYKYVCSAEYFHSRVELIQAARVSG